MILVLVGKDEGNEQLLRLEAAVRNKLIVTIMPTVNFTGKIIYHFCCCVQKVSAWFFFQNQCIFAID